MGGKELWPPALCVSVGVGRLPEPYRYGKDLNLVLQQVEIRRCPSCGEEDVVIPRIEQLHQTIAETLAGKKGSLTPAEIRFLRTHLGYSGTAFAKVMGVRPETVSRWERTQAPKRMNRQAERLLRALVFLDDPISKLGIDQDSSHTRASSLIRIESHDNQWRAA